MPNDALVQATVDAMLANMSPEALREVVKRRGKRPKVTFDDLKVADEFGNIVPFVLNPAQRRIQRSLGFDPDDKCPDIRGKRVRKRFLKGRRLGCSTYVSAIYFLDTVNNRNTRTVYMAHDGDTAKQIQQINKRFSDNLPAEKKVMPKRDSVKELYWEELDSQIRILTAGTDDPASGSTVHNLFKDERPKWKLNAEGIAAIDASTDPACRQGNIIEAGTAKGHGFFFTDWQDSVKGTGVYSCEFFAWYEDPNNRMPVPEGFVRTEEEEQRAKVYGVDNEQLQWYRETAKEMKSKMKQEYPYNWREAFLSSGSPIFDQEKLDELSVALDASDKPLERLMIPAKTYPKLHAAYAAGQLQIWEVGEDRHKYIITADSAEGLDPEHGDYDVAHVWDTVTWTQVATLRGRWNTKLYGQLLAELGWLYGTALIVPEDNNHGHAVIDSIITEEYPLQKGKQCSGLYYHRPEWFDFTSRQSKTQALKPGWPENQATKAYIIKQLEAALDEDVLTINDPQTILEMITYINLGSGKVGAEVGGYDDHVICAAIGAAMLYMKFEKGRESDEPLKPRPPQQRYGSGRR